MEESFEYTYSAPEQEEILRIRSKYLPKEEETPLEKIRRLDRETERPGSIAALILGIMGTLIFGGGMSLCLVLGNLLLGIPVGIAGSIIAAAAYPAYKTITNRQRVKVAPEILRLTEQLR